MHRGVDCAPAQHVEHVTDKTLAAVHRPLVHGVGAARGHHGRRHATKRPGHLDARHHAWGRCLAAALPDTGGRLWQVALDCERDVHGQPQFRVVEVEVVGDLGHLPDAVAHSVRMHAK